MWFVEQIYTDNEQYGKYLYEGDALVDAIHGLYTPKTAEAYRLLGKVRLPDFMTVVTHLVQIALEDSHARFTIEDAIYKMQHSDFESPLVSAMAQLQPRNQISYKTLPQYGDKQYVCLDRMTTPVIEDMLWVAYLYCKVCYSLNREPKSKKAVQVLYQELKSITEITKSVEEFREEHYLMKRSRPTLLAYVEGMKTKKSELIEQIEKTSETEDLAPLFDEQALLEYVEKINGLTLEGWEDRASTLWKALMHEEPFKTNLIAGSREIEKKFSKKFVGCIIGSLRGKVYREDTVLLVSTLEGDREAPIRKYIYDTLEHTDTPKNKIDYPSCIERLMEAYKKIRG